MTENVQTQRQAVEELIEAKMEMDERIIASIVDEIEKSFSDPTQASIISRIAVKLYQASTSVEELNVQGMYTATVIDALAKILVDDLKIIDKDALEEAVKEAHDIAKESIEEANRIAFQLEENKQTTATAVTSEVTSI